jgi:hypothetical protein
MPALKELAAMSVLRRPLSLVLPGLVVLILLATALHASSAIPDLSSPLQAERDAAARVLRETYVPPPRTNWTSLVAMLQPGMSETNVLAKLRSLNFRSDGGYGRSGVDIKTFRLDDLWVLACSFTNRVLGHRALSERMQNSWVEPSGSFTGVWTTYWVNGYRSHEMEYKSGVLHGKHTLFSTNGSTLVVSHFVNGLSEGETTGFFPSGRTNYQGQFKSGAYVGTWIWFREDGTIESKRDYANSQ